MNPPANNQKRIIVLSLIALAIVLLIIASAFSGHKHSGSNSATNQETPLLIGWLPYQTDHYKITYNFDPVAQKYTYQITLYAILNNPSQYDSYVTQLKQYKQEALAYIQSKGVDPGALTLQYLPPQASSL